MSYKTRTVGSGATSADSAEVWKIGNRTAADRNFAGRLVEIRLYNVRMTLAQLQAARSDLGQFGGNLIGCWPLWGVASPEIDL